MVAHLHNLPAAEIADAYGAIVAEIRSLELRRDALKSALIKRVNDAPVVSGATFQVSNSTAPRWHLDTAAVRTKLGEAWCTKHSKLPTVTSLRALSIAEPALPIAA